MTSDSYSAFGTTSSATNDLSNATSSAKLTRDNRTPTYSISITRFSTKESQPVTFEEMIFSRSSESQELSTEATTVITPTNSLPEDVEDEVPDDFVPYGISDPTALIGLNLPLPAYPPIQTAEDLITPDIAFFADNREPWLPLEGDGEHDVSSSTDTDYHIIVRWSTAGRPCECSSQLPGMAGHPPSCYEADRYLRGKPLVVIPDVLYSDYFLRGRRNRPYGYIEPDIEFRTKNSTTGSVWSGFGPAFDCGPLQEVVLKNLETTISGNYVAENKAKSSFTDMESLPWVLPTSCEPIEFVEKLHPYLDELADGGHVEVFCGIAFPTSQLQADAFQLACSFRPQDEKCAQLLRSATKHAFATHINARALVFKEQDSSLRNDLRQDANSKHKFSNNTCPWTNSKLLTEQLKAPLRTASKMLLQDILAGFTELARAGTQQAWATIFCALIILATSFEALQSSCQVVANGSDENPVDASNNANAKVRIIEDVFSLLFHWCDRYVKNQSEVRALLYPSPGSFDATYQLPDAASRKLVGELRQLISKHELHWKRAQVVEHSDTVNYPSRNAGQLVAGLLSHYQGPHEMSASNW